MPIILPAADVDERADSAEVVGRRHRPCRRRGLRGHEVVEERPLLGVLAVVAEEANPVHAVECRLPRPHGVQQVPPRAPERLAAVEQHARPHRVRRVAAERLGHRRQDEPPVVRLREHARAGQQPQHAVERRRVGPGRAGEVVRGARPAGEEIGDAQLGRDVDRLGEPVAVEQAAELLAG
jgi:hypothetical protein